MDFREAIRLSNVARHSEASVSTAAQAAVEVIVADLSDRRGLKWEWDKIDDDIKAEIKAVWGRVIDLVRSSAPKSSAVKFGCSLCGNLSFDQYTAHAADRNFHSDAFELFEDHDRLVLKGLKDAQLTPERQKLLERIEAGDINEDCGP